MRRALPFALLAVSLAVAPASFAQRGGGGARGGGFSGGHAGGFSSRGFSGGFSGYGSAGRFVSTVPRSFASTPFVSRGYQTPYGTMRGGWPDRRGSYYRPPYRGVGVYPYYGVGNSWAVLPWDIGYPDFSGWDTGSYQAQPDAAPAPEPAPQPDDDYRPEYQPGSYEMAATPPSEPLSPEPELTLIFRDGHQQPIRNYVLTQSSVIVLDQASSGRQQQIPLTELNLQATELAAQQAGLDFHPPA